MKFNLWTAILNPLFDADNGGGGNSGNNLPALDDVSFLASDEGDPGDEDDSSDDEKELEDDTNDGKESGDEKADESEDEESEEESDDEDDEKDTDDEEGKEPSSDGKISVKALKEQYPDIFKKNPGLKDVIFREREYSKHFATVEDAQEASAKSESFDAFESSLLQGDIGKLLDSVAESDQDAAIKLAENFLPELFQRSKPIFAKVTLPVIKGVLRQTFTRANNQGNKQLALAVQYLSRDLFENADVMKATEVEEQREDPRQAQLQQEREKFKNEQLSTANNDVLTTVTGRLHKDITAKLGSGMSDFVKEALTEKITRELDATLVKDKAHMAHLSSLWKKMSKTGITPEAKNRIISASLSRARAVLPGVIAKVKAQTGNKDSNNKPVKGKENSKVPNQTGRNSKQDRSPAKLDRKMSDFEFLSK